MFGANSAAPTLIEYFHQRNQIPIRTIINTPMKPMMYHIANLPWWMSEGDRAALELMSFATIRGCEAR